MQSSIARSASDFFRSGDKTLRINSKGHLVNNASTLRQGEGRVYDDALLQVARIRLTCIKDLTSRGLTKNLGGLGTIISMYERVGDMTGVQIDMDGRTRSQKDRVTFDEVGVPIPIFHKEWELGERVLLASRNRGESLDTTQMRLTSTIVVEAMEDAVMNGVPGFVVSGLSIYGYTTHPSRNTFTLTAAWATDTGANIIKDVQSMLNIFINKKKWGPYVIYVAKNIMVNLQGDYSAAKGDNTILQRILAFPDIESVKASDTLQNGQVVMVQMDSSTVDLAVAQDLRNLQWNTHPMSTDFMVFSAMAPRIKADRNGNCGIVHGS